MKSIKSLVAFFIFCLWALTASAQPIYVDEFNIRNANAKDSAAGNGWERRCPVVCDILRAESFDIFGSQEVLLWQISN